MCATSAARARLSRPPSRRGRPVAVCDEPTCLDVVNRGTDGGGLDPRVKVGAMDAHLAGGLVSAKLPAQDRSLDGLRVQAHDGSGFLLVEELAHIVGSGGRFRHSGGRATDRAPYRLRGGID